MRAHRSRRTERVRRVLLALLFPALLAIGSQCQSGRLSNDSRYAFDPGKESGRKRSARPSIAGTFS